MKMIVIGLGAVVLLVIIIVVAMVVCRSSKKNKSQIEDVESIRTATAQTPDMPSSKPVRLEMADTEIAKANNAGMATISHDQSNVELADAGMDETAE